MPIDIVNLPIEVSTGNPYEIKPNYRFRSIIIINDNVVKLRFGTDKTMKRYVTLPSNSSFELGKDEFDEFDLDSSKSFYLLSDGAAMTIGLIIWEFRKKKVITKQIIEVTKPEIVMKQKDSDLVWEE